MAWTNFIGPNAITSRRRAIASALIYGLSLTVRFTSPTGGETETPAQAARGINPISAIVINDGGQLFRNWPKLPQPIVFQRGWQLRSCRAACERPMPMLDCSPP